MTSGRSSVRGGLPAALMLALAGSALLLAAAGRTWARVVPPEGLGRAAVEVAGSELVPLVSVGGVVGLAAVAALLGTRGVLRQVCGALVLLLGIGVVAGVAAAGPADHVRAAAADAPAATSTGAVRRGDVRRTGWFAAGVTGGAVLACAGGLVVVRGRSWPGLSPRHERRSGGQVSRAGTTDHMWEALDRGEDPTA